MSVTNAQIANSIRVLFSHDNKFTFPTAFANRDDSRSFLSGRLREQEAELITVSDILGSGKTFLVTMVRNALESPDFKFVNDIAICGKVDPELFAQDEPIFVDEWDTKAEPEFIVQTLKMIEAAMLNRRSPIILMGDYTLRSDEMLKRLEAIAPVKSVPMEPLGPAFFNHALETRKVRVSENTGLPFIEHQIVSSEVRDAIVPNWPELTSANFREVFSTLTSMGEHDLSLDQSVGSGIDHVVMKRWLQRQASKLGRMKPAQRELLGAFSVHLKEVTGSKNLDLVRPFTTAELHTLAKSDLSLEDFHSEVLFGLAKDATFLASVGNPMIDEDALKYDKYPEPFLPGIGLRAEVMVSKYE